MKMSWTAPSASGARDGQSHDLADAGVAKIERELVARAAERELRDLDQPHHQRADDGAPRERLDPEERRQEEREQDDHEVVDERRRRAREELAVRVEDAGEQRRQPHEDRAEQHDA